MYFEKKKKGSTFVFLLNETKEKSEEREDKSRKKLGAKKNTPNCSYYTGW